jgi:NIMA (never in mitosis gene a)-related kinase
LAIKHIHDKRILHRDLKSQNVFLTEKGEIKLGDFGIAKCLKNTVEVAKTIVGTPYYFSPEIIQNKPYSFKSDIWSLGILLYEMCALKMPFDGSNLASLSIKIIKGNYTPLPTSFTKDIRCLISSLLNVDMNKRPSINEILRNSLIKQRVKNFLNEADLEKEFCMNSVNVH